jgi:DNA-binding NarL/FixJ family response regulator
MPLFKQFCGHPAGGICIASSPIYGVYVWQKLSILHTLTMAVKVLIYDDNEHLRNSIKTLLQWNEGFDESLVLPDATAVVDDVVNWKPDVIIMDIDMPPSNGVAAVKELRDNHIETPVIMLTVFEDNDNIVNAICAGASGYLLKKDMENIIPAIKDVLNGGAPMTSTIAKKVLRLFPRKKPSQSLPEGDLTHRETEILDELIKGNSYKMIGAILGISVETVRSHLKNIYKKLQVSSATEAVYKATQ